MSDVPEENYSPSWTTERQPIPTTGGDRELLTALLDYHRQTFAAKCEGVPPERLRERGVPPSTLSLHGLVRHLAGVERWWFRIQLAGEDAPMLFYTDDNPDLDFDFGEDADPVADLATWRAECAASGAVVAARGLDDAGTRKRDGAPISTRFVIAHMLAEYARHNGHADLLRERIDGRTGA